MGAKGRCFKARKYLSEQTEARLGCLRDQLRSRLRKASETMSILKLLGKHTFDVDTTKTLASAFDAAWLSLQTSGSPFAVDDRAAGTRDLLAQRIIEIAQRGESLKVLDPERPIREADITRKRRYVR